MKNFIPATLSHTHSHGKFLQEAQDIILDITGTVTALESLELDPDATITSPVSVGGGMVQFSHGKLPVPAPATKNILENYNIPYIKGSVESELCTPTGAAILAALNVKEGNLPCKYHKRGFSRGTKNLSNLPFTIYLA